MEHARQKIRLFRELPQSELLPRNGKSIVKDAHTMSVSWRGEGLFDIVLGGGGQGGAGDLDIVD